MFKYSKFLICFFLLILSQLEGAYQVCFEGVPSQEILTTLESVSILKSQSLRPPPTLFILKRRGHEDVSTLLDVMHSFGYYEAEIDYEYLGEFPDVTVMIRILPGPQYTFGEVNAFDAQGDAIFIKGSDIRSGCPVRSAQILDAEDLILQDLACAGHPLACTVEMQVVVDQESKKVNVTYLMDAGPTAYFGPVMISGLKSVKEAFIYKRILWEIGELYSPNQVECTDTFLQESGLFSFVKITAAEEVDDGDYLPMLIQLEELKHRHIGAGISYSTDESAGALLQWSHDNLHGMGDAFSFVGEYSEVVKRATLLYGVPDVWRRGQDFSASVEARREDAPGFIEKEMSVLLRMSQKINDCFSYSYAARYERLLSTKSDNDENYNLFSLPLQIRWDTSNRLLNPTSGTTIIYWPTPYKAVFNSHIFFFKQELFASTYQPISPNKNLILAFSAQFGSIIGQSRILIPAPKRFYAGSSTGLRGYKYLTVSPLDGKKPLGGRSLMIFQIEPRYRITQKLYFASFFDIGNVYATPFPSLNEKMLRSAGCGIRYLTPLGPFRLDIAFPLDKRKGIDKTFQIYASIGQTF